MSKNSFNELLAGLEAELKPGADGEERVSVSPAERLGRAMLDRFGTAEGMSESELVDAILGEWNARKEPSGMPAEPFEPVPKLPVPMKAGVNTPQPADYADMPAKQFNELKKLLKKAALDGKRMKI
ncbi:MAG: hypothetical protein J5854_00070 [Clostridia bacterium]|nr:hypothetical protein [Clostridia bacterium]